ncbi:hypothetical protein IE53DRAFT_347123 [Violaceomyces palustris]|uniref:Uncharacterized protein n=1 Tax=Violaceomyces palustris TaxID=1673888 RepID=A0ACD0NS63_9BASI|nr:hypothetical protein IE53DRAFT_347123 [Violaceomyces palustris]
MNAATTPNSSSSSAKPATEEHPINTPSWHKDLPQPSQREILNITADELAQLIQDEEEKGLAPGASRDFLVIDVRRADCETLIPGAINLPAHSFLPSLPSLLPLLSPIPLLIFHCGKNNGRGTRCAQWFSDALEKDLGMKEEEIREKVKLLKGGHVGWVEKFGKVGLEKRAHREGLKALQL